MSGSEATLVEPLPISALTVSLYITAILCGPGSSVKRVILLNKEFEISLPFKARNSKPLGIEKELAQALTLINKDNIHILILCHMAFQIQQFLIQQF